MIKAGWIKGADWRSADFGDVKRREIRSLAWRERWKKRKVLEAGGDSAETDRMEGGEMRSAESQTEARLKLQAETA